MSDINNEPAVRLCKGDCGRLTRPRNTAAQEGVETVARINAKYCYPCYSRRSPAVMAKRAREAEARELEKKVRLEATQKAYSAFLATRQRRLGDLPRRSRVLVVQ